MAKTPEKTDGAFRTIREVADWLGVPTHVLRFWESKFDQIAPVKGPGGRRYYRPEDMKLLGGIKVMLHDQGLPIRGVGAKIDDDGVESVMALSPDIDTPGTTAPKTRRVIRNDKDAEPPRVVPFDRKRPETARDDPDTPDLPDEIPAPDETASPQPDAPDHPTRPGDETIPAQPTDEAVPEPATAPAQPDAPPSAPAPETPAAPMLPPLDLTAENRRKLRRIVRKLRGLIEEVEDELGAAPKS